MKKENAHAIFLLSIFISFIVSFPLIGYVHDAPRSIITKLSKIIGYFPAVLLETLKGSFKLSTPQNAVAIGAFCLPFVLSLLVFKYLLKMVPKDELNKPVEKTDPADLVKGVIFGSLIAGVFILFSVIWTTFSSWAPRATY